MLIRVNKNTGNRRQTVKYAALSTGTISHVWYDEDSVSGAAPKRQNRIKMIRATPEKENSTPNYDA